MAASTMRRTSALASASAAATIREASNPSNSRLRPIRSLSGPNTAVSTMPAAMDAVSNPPIAPPDQCSARR